MGTIWYRLAWYLQGSPQSPYPHWIPDIVDKEGTLCYGLSPAYYLLVLLLQVVKWECNDKAGRRHHRGRDCQNIIGNLLPVNVVAVYPSIVPSASCLIITFLFSDLEKQ